MTYAEWFAWGLICFLLLALTIILGYAVRDPYRRTRIEVEPMSWLAIILMILPWIEKIIAWLAGGAAIGPKQTKAVGQLLLRCENLKVAASQRGIAPAQVEEPITLFGGTLGEDAI